ncbi:MAG: nuclear transport factor 2 family protein [Phycisphaerae bacterium]|nr:nuclear transport factor 2 family protein [Planctomycetota bacterium]MBL7219671.1 nuclear transport factor 2 family protein [Phycisphaerae bacterium]
MKTNFLLLLVLAMSAISCMGPGNHNATAIKGEIMAVMNQQAKDWSAGDYEAFMKGYHNSKDIRFAHPKGITRGWRGVLDAYKRNPKKSRLEFSNIDITPLSPKTALVFGRFHNYVEDNTYKTGLFTLLVRKIDGQWKAVHDHSSDLPADYKEK